MNELVINGCSYTVNWSPLDLELGNRLKASKTTNLSLPGSSNSRIFRSTLEYILKNRVDFVILAVTFWDRQEAPWNNSNTIWTDYSPNGPMRPAEIKQDDLYNNYIQDRYRYDLDYNYIDKLLNDIIIFSGWLESQNIRYLIFSSAENPLGEPKFLFEYYKRIQEKIQYIRKNVNIIDFENWNSNQYMYDNGGISNDTNAPPNSKHYDAKSFAILNDFLYNYIKQHNI